jgi:type VI protein secretion system component Hcp
MAQRARTALPAALRSPAARAVAAVGCAAGVLTVFALPPASGAAAVAAPDRIIRHSITDTPTPSFIIPSIPIIFPSSTSPATQPGTVSTTTSASHPKGSHSPKASASASAVAGYVSTFSAVALVSTPDATGSAVCAADGQPVTKAGGGDLDLPGIGGTSTDAGHNGALTITSIGPSSMLPPQIDSASLTEVQITRPVDASSANLAMVASSGYRFGCAHIELGPGAGYSSGYGSVEYALSNAGLVSDDREGNTEILTVTYSSIAWAYTVPGSSTVHTGSGLINARPDKVSANIATDSRKIAEGTIGLAAVAALGLIVLYFIGRRRNRKRYRTRYYRRVAARARQAEQQQYQQHQEAQNQQFQLYQQYQQEQQAQQEQQQPEPEAKPEPELVQEAEPVLAREPEPEPEADLVQEPKAALDLAQEPEPVLESEPESEPEAAAQAEPGAEPESELESEPEPEREPEPEAVTDSEPDAEAEAEAEALAEEEAEPEHEAELEPEAKAEADAEPEPQAEAEAEPEPEPEAELKPEAEAKAEPVAEPEREAEPEAEPESKPAEPEAKAELEPETGPEAEPVPEPEPEPEPKLEFKPQPRTAPRPEPIPIVEADDEASEIIDYLNTPIT